MRIHPVILCGGSGTRLWPLSRALLPKQFLPLAGTRTMLQETALRLAGLRDATAPILISHVDHRFLVAEQLREASSALAMHLLEPEGRNTAPAIAAAAVGAHLGPDARPIPDLEGTTVTQTSHGRSGELHLGAVAGTERVLLRWSRAHRQQCQ